MGVNLPNRSVIRSTIASSLASSIVGTSKPVTAVYPYKPKKFKLGTPAVCVSSAGASRTAASIADNTDTAFMLDLHIFVRYSDQSGSTWDEEDSENALDLIEKSVSDWLADNRTGTDWDWLETDGDSTVDVVVIGGVEYQHEMIPIKAKMLSE